MAASPPDGPVGHEREFDRLDSALETADDTVRIAVCSPPGGGRERFLDHAEQRLVDATRVRLGPWAMAESNTEWPTDGALVVDDCHHLYSRRIGGFDALDSFLEAIASFEGPVVTSWNSYSWEYLVEAQGLRQAFSEPISLPALGRDAFIERVRADVDGTPIECLDDRDITREPLVTIDERPVSLPNRRTVSVPVPRLNRDELARRRAGNDDESAESVVFGRLNTLAGGYPGVAVVLIEEAVDDDTLAYSELPSPPDVPTGDYDVTFALHVLLSKERVRRQELTAVVGRDSLDRMLGELDRAGVLVDDGETVGLEPIALEPVTDLLDRRRLLW